MYRGRRIWSGVPDKVYLVVIDGAIKGPYSKLSAAKGVLTGARNYHSRRRSDYDYARILGEQDWYRNPGAFEGHILQTDAEWRKFDVDGLERN